MVLQLTTCRLRRNGGVMESVMAELDVMRRQRRGVCVNTPGSETLVKLVSCGVSFSAPVELYSSLLICGVSIDLASHNI